jgi:hypothetical protein
MNSSSFRDYCLSKKEDPLRDESRDSLDACNHLSFTRPPGPGNLDHSGSFFEVFSWNSFAMNGPRRYNATVEIEDWRPRDGRPPHAGETRAGVAFLPATSCSPLVLAPRNGPGKPFTCTSKLPTKRWGRKVSLGCVFSRRPGPHESSDAADPGSSHTVI